MGEQHAWPRGAATDAPTSKWTDKDLEVALDIIPAGPKADAAALVQDMLGVELSNAAVVIIEHVAAKKLDTSTARGPLRRLLSQDRVEDILAVGLDLLVLGRGDASLVGSMLSIPMTRSMGAILHRVQSGKIDRSAAHEPLMRLIKDEKISQAYHSVATEGTLGQTAVEIHSQRKNAVVEAPANVRSGYELKDALVSYTKAHQGKAENSNKTQIVDPRLVARHQNTPRDAAKKFSPPLGPSAKPPISTGCTELSHHKRERSLESPLQNHDSKRVRVPPRDCHVNLQQMLENIRRLTQRPPPPEMVNKMEVPVDACNRRGGYIHPYSTEHPDKCGKVHPSIYGAGEEQDLGLCYATWCRTERQCLVGEDCPWAHYVNLFRLEFIWGRGENQEGFRFLKKAVKCLQAGGQEPVHTGRLWGGSYRLSKGGVAGEQQSRRRP